MDRKADSPDRIDRQQAEAIAQALLAEGQARQSEQVLQRWRMREQRRGQTRAALLAMGATALAWGIAQAMAWHIAPLGLAAVWVPVYLSARRVFASRASARAVIES